MPHWWIKIESSPIGARLEEVRRIVKENGGTLEADTIFYEDGVTTSALALVSLPDDTAPRILKQLRTKQSRRLNSADEQQGIFPDDPPQTAY